jgi:hypothetical protein
MGYDRHHAIVVTTFSDGYAARAFDRARELFAPVGCPVSAPVLSGVNHWLTLFIGPDGSKEGWDASDAGDRARDAFVGWLEGERYEDGSSLYAWVEVQYGDERRETKIVRDSDAASRAAAARARS